MGSESEHTTALNLILSRLTGSKQIPGMAVACSKHSNLIWNKGYGFANIEEEIPVDPERTLFRSASASKPIAATALARMVEEGSIDLDASFYEYVPYFPKKRYDFTIRQLASHTAGIRAYRGKEFALNKAYTIEESIVIFKEDPLLFEPGTSYLYNSFDWVLISLAMQEAAGKSFDEIVSQTVLLPLGMKNTSPEIPSAKLRDQARFYTRSGKGFRPAVAVDNRYKLAGGGYLSTVGDLLLLGQSYLDKTFLDPKVSAEFLKAVQIDGKSTFYGLGWEVSRDRHGREFYGHTGSSVGAYSNFYVYPDQGAVVAILINCTDPKIQPQLDSAIDVLLRMDPAV